MTVYLLASELEEANPAGYAWELIWILFVLGVIVALIIMLLRFLGKRSRGWGPNRSLRSLGGYPLGMNKSLQIVEWNGRIYVLGVGENVTLLDSITDPDLAAAVLAEHDTLAESSAPILPAWLRKRLPLRQPSAGTGDSPGGQDRPSFEQTLEERLRQLAERRRRAEQLLEEKPPEERSDRL